jgi:S1-C subfamily serine protease
LPSSSYAKALESAYELDDTVRDLIPSVVLIVGLGDEINLGSGFIVSEDGRVVTNQHVIDGAEQTYAVWDSTVGRPFEECNILFKDEELDIALLELPGEKYTPIPIARVDHAEIADEIICLGFPIVDSDNFLEDTFNIAVTRGIIASIQRDAEGEIAEVWTDAAITYGNSGGPLYDLDLEGVIGINNLFAEKAKGNYNLAIPYTRFETRVSGWEDEKALYEAGIKLETASDVLEGALSQYEQGELTVAIEILEKGVDQYPDVETVELKLKLAEWYIEAERYGKAFSLYESLGEDRPDDDEFLTDYGVLAYQAEEYRRAVEILLPLIPLANDTVYITLALSYLELEQHTEAATYATLAKKATESEQVGFLAEEVLAEVRGNHEE